MPYLPHYVYPPLVRVPQAAQFPAVLEPLLAPEIGPDGPSVTLDGVEERGVGDCDVVRALDGQGEAQLRLATCVHLAAACRRAGRPLDELAALRRAARELAVPPTAGLAGRIAELAAEHDAPRPLAGGWSIVDYPRDPKGFCALAGISDEVHDAFWHPGARLSGLAGTVGLPAEGHGWGGDNVSFHLCHDDRLVATVPAVIDAAHVLAWGRTHPGAPTMPIEIRLADEPVGSDGPVEPVDRSRVLELVWDELRRLVRVWGATCFRVMERPEDDHLLHRLVVRKARRYGAELWDRPVADLGEDEATLFGGVRKSFRSNINWCRKNLVTQYLSGAELTAETVRSLYLTMQELHASLIERYGDGMTNYLFLRPLLMCVVGMGEVAVTRTPDGTAQAMTATTYDGGVAYYALGGSRTLEGKHVGHFAVYDSMLRAKQKGMHTYVFDRFNGPSVGFDGRVVVERWSREDNILFFKRGFSDDSEVVAVYTVFA